MSIFASVQARHFYLTRSTIQCALAAIQQATPTSTPSLGPCRQDAAQDKVMRYQDTQLICLQDIHVFSGHAP